MKKIEVIERVRVHEGFYPVDRLKLRCTRFRGGWSPVYEREIYGRTQPVVVVVLYDPVQYETLLLEQCRIGPLEYTPDERAWLLEPVAGHADEGETLEQACIREVEEETGIVLQPNQLEYVLEYYPTPGGGRERIFLFAAACSLEKTAEQGGLEAEGEDIRLHVFSFEKVLAQLKQGGFNVASTLIGLQWLIYNKWPQLKKADV